MGIQSVVLVCRRRCCGRKAVPSSSGQRLKSAWAALGKDGKSLRSTGGVQEDCATRSYRQAGRARATMRYGADEQTSHDESMVSTDCGAMVSTVIIEPI